MFRRFHFAQSFVAALAWLAISQFAVAQPPNQGNGGVQISSGPSGGVEVDAGGVVRTKTITEQDRKLALERIRAEVAKGDRKLNAPTQLRYISLRRLEAAVAAAAEKGEKPSSEMLNLAGLTKLRYVFLYPDSQDIVIAGPAEGFTTDPAGHAIGMHSGAAVVQLEDLVAALRAFAPGGKGERVIRCSIDPTPEGLKALQAKVGEIGRSLRRAPTAEQTQAITNSLRDALGLQTVTVEGVSTKTRFAHVLVEADYRMKLIGIGMDRPAVKITSYVSAADPAAIARNALKRWYFVPDYQCLKVSEDSQALELVGNTVKLIGADELVGRDGSRQEAGPVDTASKKFVESFTKAYPQLARVAPIYADLRNVIDLAVAGAFMQQQDYFTKAGWKMETFGNEKKFPIETYHAPKQIPSACTAVWKGSRLATPIGGGIQIVPGQALTTENRLADDGGKVAKQRDGVQFKDLPAGQWWWDAAPAK